MEDLVRKRRYISLGGLRGSVCGNGLMEIQYRSVREVILETGFLHELSLVSNFGKISH